MWPKEKLLIMSNFSFGHNVFKRRLLLLHQNVSAGGKGLKVVYSRFVVCWKGKQTCHHPWSKVIISNKSVSFWMFSIVYIFTFTKGSWNDQNRIQKYSVYNWTNHNKSVERNFQHHLSICQHDRQMNRKLNLR